MKNCSAKEKYNANEKGVFVKRSAGDGDIAFGGSGVRKT